MKTKAKRAQETKEYVIDKMGDDRILRHFLSPIEVAANKANYDVFTYKIEGVLFDINPELCNDLMQITFRKVKFLNDFVTKLITNKLHSNPKFEKFLYTPLIDHKLPTRLYHCLYGNDCKNLSDVLRLGRSGVLKIHGVGHNSINEIVTLLKKHECESLFE